MYCRRCGEKAEIHLRRHRAAFCSKCFLEYYDRQVNRNIRKEKMFGFEDRLMMVVSGGKDSMALWDWLLKKGYNVIAMHIDLGIGEYSKDSRELVEQFSQDRKAELIVVDIEQEYGFTIPSLARKTRRSFCSVCGLVKRYLFNKVALDGEFNVVVTGHNLDDEAATLLGNTLSWQVGYLARQAPVLPSDHPKLKKKVKPLFTLTERENLAYVLINGIEFIHEDCPYSKGANSILYKETLNRLEEANPGTKQRFLATFLRKGRKYFQVYKEDLKLHECENCGQVTTAEVCSFCRLLERLQQK